MSKKLQSVIDKGLAGDVKEAKRILMQHLGEIDKDEELVAKLEKDIELYRDWIKKAFKYYTIGDTAKGNECVVKAKVLLDIVHEDDKAIDKEEKHLK